MTLIADESWQKVNPASLKSLGYSGIIGYVSQDTTGKNLTKQNVADAHSAGMSVTLIYEFNPSDALGGGAAALKSSAIAVNGAMSLSAPSDIAIYAAVDIDATPAQYPTISEYANTFMNQCARSGFRSGIYGDYGVIAYLFGHGYHGLLWQTYAWSYSKIFPHVSLYQMQNGIHAAGGTFDRDKAEVTDWGQWNPPASGSTQQPVDMLTRYWQTVKNGDNGAFPIRAEGLLVANGFPVGCDANHLDGDFGPVCESSTKAFQSKFHLPVTGVFDARTLSVAIFGRDVI